MKIKIFLLLIVSPFLIQSQGIKEISSSSSNDKMLWFEEAKLGIFIHWGIYSVNGISESWSFYNGYISHYDYMKQLKGFTANNFDPKKWSNLIEESGAKYTVITTKHHDGFALWDSKYGNLNSYKSSTSKKDLLSPFIREIKSKGIKLGLYYSLPDWSYKDYTHHTNKIKRYNIQENPKRWNRFLKYRDGQLKELKTRYNPDLWWFDGDWEHNAVEWRIIELKNMLKKK